MPFDPGETRYLYAVLDSGGYPVYIGCSNNPYRRLLDHWNQCPGHVGSDYGWPFYQWLAGEREAGRMPRIIPYAIAEEDWGQHESREIARLATLYSLLNVVYKGSPLAWERRHKREERIEDARYKRELQAWYDARPARVTVFEPAGADVDDWCQAAVVYD